MWFFLAIASYGAFAVTSVGDKILLTEPRMHAGAYAFLVGTAGSILLLGIIVLGIPLPEAGTLAVALISGVTFVAALIPYYAGIKRFEVSRIVPASGGLVPLFLFFFLPLVAPHALRLTAWEVAAFSLLVLGTVFIAYDPKARVPYAALPYAFLYAVLMAASILLLKYAFLHDTLWAGLLWRQIGGILFAAALFAASKKVRVGVAGLRPAQKQKTLRAPLFFLFFLFQGIGGLAILLQNGALYAAPARLVPFVQALQGVQYAFVLLFAALLAFRFPGLLREHASRHTIRLKFLAILLIMAGIALLAS